MAKANPKVGVLIPVYNGAKFISDALQSVADQTYSNVKAYIVDDGSTDDLYSVIAATHPDYIPFYKFKQNKGNPYAMNKCAELAIKDGCDFVQVLAADDLLTNEDSIQFMLDTFDDETNMVFPWLKLIDENGSFIRIHETFDRSTYQREMEGSTLVGHIMYRAKAWQELGGYTYDYLSVTRSSWEDYDMWTRALRLYNNVYKVCKYPTITYRVHPGQQTNVMVPLQDKLREIYKKRHGIS